MRRTNGAFSGRERVAALVAVILAAAAVGAGLYIDRTTAPPLGAYDQTFEAPVSGDVLDASPIG